MQTLWAGSVLFFFPTPSSVPITLKSLASQASVTLRIHGSASCYYDCLLLARKDKKRTREMRFSAARALIVIRKPDPPVQPTLRSVCQQTEGLKEETGTDQMPSHWGGAAERGESTTKNTGERAGRDTPYRNGNSNAMLSHFLPVSISMLPSCWWHPWERKGCENTSKQIWLCAALFGSLLDWVSGLPFFAPRDAGSSQHCDSARHFFFP